MEAHNQTAVPSEVKVTVELLLDTEKKIEILQLQLDEISSGTGPAYKLTPPGYGNIRGNSSNRKAQLQADIFNLKTTTLSITTEIKNAASGETKQRVHRLVEEWKMDIGAVKDNDDKDVSKLQKGFTRKLNKDWDALKHPSQVQSPFRNNMDEIDGRKASYLDIWIRQGDLKKTMPILTRMKPNHQRTWSNRKSRSQKLTTRT